MEQINAETSADIAAAKLKQKPCWKHAETSTQPRKTLAKTVAESAQTRNRTSFCRCEKKQHPRQLCSYKQRCCARKTIDEIDHQTIKTILTNIDFEKFD